MSLAARAARRGLSGGFGEEGAASVGCWESAGSVDGAGELGDALSDDAGIMSDLGSCGVVVCSCEVIAPVNGREQWFGLT